MGAGERGWGRQLFELRLVFATRDRVREGWIANSKSKQQRTKKQTPFKGA